jgi:hypothetical protein
MTASTLFACFLIFRKYISVIMLGYPSTFQERMTSWVFLQKRKLVKLDLGDALNSLCALEEIRLELQMVVP